MDGTMGLRTLVDGANRASPTLSRDQARQTDTYNVQDRENRFGVSAHLRRRHDGSRTPDVVRGKCGSSDWSESTIRRNHRYEAGAPPPNRGPNGDDQGPSNVSKLWYATLLRYSGRRDYHNSVYAAGEAVRNF